MEEEFRRHNHYVSCAYLRRFAGSNGRVFTYRTLVSHLHIRHWTERSIKRVAYHSHLYTRIGVGGETDEIEKWLDREFEAPAEEPLRKATSDERLSPNDWKHLIRFVAAQDVRTPSRLLDNLRRWNRDMPRVLNSTLQQVVQKIEAAKASGESFSQPKGNNTEYLPIRATAEIKPGEVLEN